MIKQLHLSVIYIVLFWLVTSTSGLWKPKYVEPEVLDKLLRTKQYSLFCKMLGIPDVSLVIPRKGDFTAEELMINENLKFGDIMPYPWESKKCSTSKRRKVRQAINFSMYPVSKWNLTVPFVIEKDGFRPNQKKTILDQIESFNNRVQNIKFVPRESERDYIYFINGNGCYSYIGRLGGVQILSLQRNGCLTPRIIPHEMIHALGINHEHNRSDRDNYVRVLYENIPPVHYPEFIKEDPVNFKLILTYDYYSVMHYFYTFPNTNKPSFEILMDGVDKQRIGGKNLTDRDVEKIKTLYQQN